jgi:hypothetical protein
MNWPKYTGGALLLVASSLLVGCPSPLQPDGGTEIDSGNNDAGIADSGCASGRLTVSPITYDFGTIALGGSASALFTVTNGECATTGVLTASVTGADAGQFEITPGSDKCSGETLPTNASCEVGVTIFVSQAYEVASLDVAANPGGSASAALVGAGQVNCPFNIAPTSNDFGSTPLGQESNPFTFTVYQRLGVHHGHDPDADRRDESQRLPGELR